MSMSLRWGLRQVRGGLVSALESLARESDLDVGTPYSEHASGPGRYKSAVVETERDTMSMLLGKHERMFSKWLRTAEVYDVERPLVEAAGADGRLRGLFPHLSHRILRLSTELGRQGAREIQICPVTGGSYRVEDTASGGGVRDAVTLEEAVDAAADLLQNTQPGPAGS